MKEIQLNTEVATSPYYKKYKALVDDEDFERVNAHKWCVRVNKRNLYATTSIRGKIITMHHFLLGRKMTDHKDNNGLNNQKSNLRQVTTQQNAMNARKRIGASSKYKGVSWNRNCKKWTSQIRVEKRKIHLGYFENEVDGAKAYNKQAKKHFGKFANLNII